MDRRPSAGFRNGRRAGGAGSGRPSDGPKRRPKGDKAAAAPAPVDRLEDGAEAALQIGPTDQGMVRLIITTASGVSELDFPPDEAREIAEELLASADRIAPR